MRARDALVTERFLKRKDSSGSTESMRLISSRAGLPWLDQAPKPGHPRDGPADAGRYAREDPMRGSRLATNVGMSGTCRSPAWIAFSRR
jgi:hypothetical protein